MITKVLHETHGEGSLIPGMHSQPDADGNIEFYDVMFEHGIEQNVPAEELQELSKKTLGSYVKHAAVDVQAKGEKIRRLGDLVSRASNNDDMYTALNSQGKAYKARDNRQRGIRTAVDKITKEENDLDDTLGLNEVHETYSTQVAAVRHGKAFAKQGGHDVWISHHEGKFHAYGSKNEALVTSTRHYLDDYGAKHLGWIDPAGKEYMREESIEEVEPMLDEARNPHGPAALRDVTDVDGVRKRTTPDGEVYRFGASAYQPKKRVPDEHTELAKHVSSKLNAAGIKHTVVKHDYSVGSNPNGRPDTFWGIEHNYVDVKLHHPTTTKEEVEPMLDEARGRPKKVIPMVTKKPEEEADDGESNNIHVQLMKKHGGPIKFANGEEVKIPSYERVAALAHLNSLRGPGKDPMERLKHVRNMAKSYDQFRKHVGLDEDTIYDKDMITESNSDGYFVTNHKHEIVHDRPFLDSKAAIRHANKEEDRTARVHTVTHVKSGKIVKQWQYAGGHIDPKWEHYDDYKGEPFSAAKAKSQLPTSKDRGMAESVEPIEELSRRGIISRYINKTRDDPKRKEGNTLALTKKWGDKEYGFDEPKVKATESVEVKKVTPATAALRMPALEDAIVGITSKGRDVAVEAAEAKWRANNPEVLDELSKKTLGSYIKKAAGEGGN